MWVLSGLERVGCRFVRFKDYQGLFGCKRKNKICMCTTMPQVRSHDLKDEGHKKVIVAESCHLKVFNQRNNFVDKCEHCT